MLVLSLLATINGFTLTGENRYGSKTSFFGGFGFGESSTPSKSRKKKKKGKRLTNELIPNKDTNDVFSMTQEALGPEKKVDKWGLPIQTEDEIIEELFPSMSKETEMIPVVSGKEYTLPEIQDCLGNQIDLNLGRFFDENGAATQSNAAKPIQLKLLHQSPPVLAIDNLFSDTECEELRNASLVGHEVSSATFTGSLSTRTSTSWFCNYADVPLLLAKVNQYLNIPLELMEEPQIVRYQKGEEFSWHYDAVPENALENGGQRLATLLVYLTDIASEDGGGTMFRDLKYDSEPLSMQPKVGSALLFFPAKSDGTPDARTLHRSEVMTGDEEKWIIQMWIHEREYKAVLPIGNSHELAGDGVRKTIVKLGLADDQ
ncbi:unnamed protein product [Cylindrotheca closterium]|uniref:Fe2OG dioxygenase domain-containing protein n=1 Tax=Cylindrotheca closterium TaxID=2856 RepID=A0AAD2FHQ1_9STRA|nr:unnamed protein product [Cylindrotheca closterium]